MAEKRVVVLGAGIIGLAVADELLRRGHAVTVRDPAPARGASYAAAGMLSPGGELWHGERALFRLGRTAAALWPAYADRLGVAWRPTGTVLVGRDAADLQEVDRRAALLRETGVEATPQTRRELQAREPGLGRVAGGVVLADDHSVDPRAVLTALRERVPVEPTAQRSSVAAAAAVESDEIVVIATGATLPAPFTDLVRGVRGEILRVRTDDPLHGTVRGWAHGQPVYAVPRPVRDGWQEVAIGATSEEHAGTPVPHVEGVFRLLAAARSLVPGLDRAEFVEALARDRPATADHLPLIGPTQHDGVLLAAGHHRAGVLLAPLTAHLIADHLETGVVDPAVDPRRVREGDA